MSNIDTIIQSKSASFSNAVQSIIGRTCIIDFGTISKVLADGVVEVMSSVAIEKEDVRIIPCVFVVPSTSALMLHITPVVGDKVLIISPRRYSAGMFEQTKDDNGNIVVQSIIDSNGMGYSSFTSLALPVNQFQTSDYHNTLAIDNGTITANLGYVKGSTDSDSYNSLVLTTKADGSLSLVTNSAKGTKVVSVEVAVDKENGNTVSIADSNSCSIEMSRNGTVINGKLTIK